MKKNKITKADLEALYQRPIDPNKPFERLQALMRWGVQVLAGIQKKTSGGPAPVNELVSGTVGSMNFFEPDQSELNEDK